MREFKRFIPYRDRPLCFLDIETTGTKPGYHEITEIGFRHEKLGGLCLQIAPQYIERAEPEALKVSGYNTADWADAKSLKSSLPTILPYIENATVVCHNGAGFDIPMIRGNLDMIEVSHDELFRDTIDTMSLARVFLVPLGLNMLSMKSCMKFMGEDYEGAHNAYEDALFCEKLYRFISENLRWHGTKDGKRIQESLF